MPVQVPVARSPIPAALTLGQQESQCPSATRGPPAMAVRADDLALFDLVENGLPASIVDFPPDVEELLAQVVKLQDDRVVLSAVDAGMGLEVLD